MVKTHTTKMAKANPKIKRKRRELNSIDAIWLLKIDKMIYGKAGSVTKVEN